MEIHLLIRTSISIFIGVYFYCAIVFGAIPAFYALKGYVLMCKQLCHDSRPTMFLTTKTTVYYLGFILTSIVGWPIYLAQTKKSQRHQKQENKSEENDHHS